MSYAVEKFKKAVRELAGKGSQRERLISAYRGGLTNLELGDLPEPLREDFQQLRNQITRQVPADGQSRVLSTVNTMDDQEITELIEKIIRIYEILLRME